MNDWRARGACQGQPTRIFYPDSIGAGRPRNDGTSRADQDVAPALALCAVCPVLLDCRTWALHHETDGIWGGMTEHERRSQRRRLGIRLRDPVVDDDTWKPTRAATLFRQGWTIRDIAIELRVHDKQVNRWLDSQGLDAHPPRWIPRETAA